MPEFGLLGKNISYSFSRDYFTEKFRKENLPYQYINFDIETIEDLTTILKNNKDLIGLNVTIPYKEAVMPFMDELSKNARKIGAVNTIEITRAGKLIGHNTDHYGFRKSVKPFLKEHHKNALILGTGGASKAIAYALKSLKINFDYVSRSANGKAKFLYSDLTTQIINTYSIIINCTPIGTYPDVNECPNIPYEGITQNHLLYDLVYNPPTSKFLICGEVKGAEIKNGRQMLELQADRAWQIWMGR